MTPSPVEGLPHISQDSIKNSFKRPYEDTTLDDLTQKIRKGSVHPDPIRIVEKDEITYTLDNRRLYSYQQAGVPIRYEKLDDIPKRQLFKFTTDNGGVSIEVRN